MSKYIRSASVLRRFLFAATFLPARYPNYIDTICRFAVWQTEHPPLDTGIAKVLLDNLKLLDNTALMKDCELTKQIVDVHCVSGKQTGVVLVPEQDTCSGCGTTLLLRSERPSRLALYTETMGALP